MSEARPHRWQTRLAFAIIYLVWGSTYLAIRIGVRELPPLLFAGMRFLIAGAAIFLWSLAKGTPWPMPRQWRSATLLAILIFVIDYGCVFWAERRVASGITAVMMATIPGLTALAEIFLLQTRRMTVRLIFGLLVGFGGVAALMSPSGFGQSAIDPIGAAALIVGAIAWSVGSVLTRKLPLPQSKVMSSGVQMLVGGILLLMTAALLGEFNGFSIRNVSLATWAALVYLIVAGSIIAFTAYIWLIAHESPTKVGTYAYVNPVVAVLLGYFLGGEPLGWRTLAGTALVLASVGMIATAPKNKLEAPGPRKDALEVAEGVKD